MTKENVITNKVRKTLAKMAKSLPACHYNDRTEMVKVGTIDKHTIRVQKQPKPVNHKKNIEKAYQTKGKVGVYEYCKGVVELVEASKSKTKESE